MAAPGPVSPPPVHPTVGGMYVAVAIALMSTGMQASGEGPNWTSKVIQGFRRGEAASVAALYRRYRQRLFKIVDRRCARSEYRIQADDVVQETFIRAFSERARASFDASRPFLPFLVGISVRVYADAARAHRRAHAPASTHLTDSVAAADGELDVLAIRRVRSYVAALPPELRRVYRERFENDNSQRGAAKRLGLSHQKMRTLEQTLLGDGHGAIRLRRRPANVVEEASCVRVVGVQPSAPAFVVSVHPSNAGEIWQKAR
jgi:RNA polymerase sigma factor (sigma-70 family)